MPAGEAHLGVAGVGIGRHFGAYLTDEETVVLTRALLKVAGAGGTEVRLSR